jgi:hypothetical protein
MYIVLLYSIWMSICGYIYTFLWFLRQTDAFLKFLWPCIQVLIEWRSCTYVRVLSFTYSRYINIRYAVCRYSTCLQCLNMALSVHKYDILYCHICASRCHKESTKGLQEQKKYLENLRIPMYTVLMRETTPRISFSLSMMGMHSRDLTEKTVQHYSMTGHDLRTLVMKCFIPPP